MIFIDNRYIFTDIITKPHKKFQEEIYGKPIFPWKTERVELLYCETFRDKESLADRSLRGMGDKQIYGITATASPGLPRRSR